MRNKDDSGTKKETKLLSNSNKNHKYTDWFYLQVPDILVFRKIK